MDVNGFKMPLMETRLIFQPRQGLLITVASAEQSVIKPKLIINGSLRRRSSEGKIYYLGKKFSSTYGRRYVIPPHVHKTYVSDCFWLFLYLH